VPATLLELSCPCDDDGVLRAARYIEASIGRPISLGDIAARSDWSTHHFHRQFRARVGLPVMDYVRRRRLTIAAERLIESDTPILELALDAGFDSQAAFTRAFTRLFRRPPAAYRLHGRAVPWLSVSAITGATLALLPGLGVTSPRCVMHPPIQLAGLEVTLTAYERKSIPAMWRELASILRAKHVDVHVAYGVSSPVPRASDGLLTYGAAVAVDHGVARHVTGDLITGGIPAGRYLVFPFRGARAGLPPAIDFIYGTWIPGSGHLLRPAPTLEVYSRPFEMDRSGAIELWIPIA
jgi:AraC family transcriptional regulator